MTSAVISEYMYIYISVTSPRISNNTLRVEDRTVTCQARGIAITHSIC